MSDFPEITTEQIVARLRMIVAEPDSLCKTDFHYIEDAADEIELLRSTVTDCRIEIESTRAERDEARRLLKGVIDICKETTLPTDAVPSHDCSYKFRTDIGMCKMCADWTDALAMIYPDEFQDEEDGK